jgi:hypothetical protein
MGMVNGLVEGVSTKFEKYGVLVNGTWYSTKMEWAKCKPNKGDQVEFDDGGGKFTKNMRVVSAGSPPSPSSSGTTSAPAKSGGYSRGSFPIGLEDGQRSIIRQNALTNARELIGLTLMTVEGFNPETVAASVIALAREFEAYTAGDIERRIAEDMAEEFSVS